jgi:DNA-binding FrmR family transcriptional regulator
MPVLRSVRVDRHPADRIDGPVSVCGLSLAADDRFGAHDFVSCGIDANTLRGYISGMHNDIKSSCLKRLGRIEGQVRGLARMVEQDRYCIDVVTQISAVRAALRRVEEEVLRDHVAHCVEHAITSGNKADQRKKIAELMDVVSRADR